MGKSARPHKRVKRSMERGSSNFIQIVLVLICGAAVLYFMSGKARELSGQKAGSKKNIASEGRSDPSEPSLMEKLSGVASTNDRVTRSDRKELEDLLDKVGN